MVISIPLDSFEFRKLVTAVYVAEGNELSNALDILSCYGDEEETQFLDKFELLSYEEQEMLYKAALAAINDYEPGSFLPIEDYFDGFIKK